VPEVDQTFVVAIPSSVKMINMEVPEDADTLVAFIQALGATLAELTGADSESESDSDTSIVIKIKSVNGQLVDQTPTRRALWENGECVVDFDIVLSTKCAGTCDVAAVTADVVDSVTSISDTMVAAIADKSFVAKLKEKAAEHEELADVDFSALTVEEFQPITVQTIEASVVEAESNLLLGGAGRLGMGIGVALVGVVLSSMAVL